MAARNYMKFKRSLANGDGAECLSVATSSDYKCALIGVVRDAQLPTTLKFPGVEVAPLLAPRTRSPEAQFCNLWWINPGVRFFGC